MEKTIKTSAINYGLYLGIILIALTGIGYAVSLDLFVELWFGFLILFIILVMGIISTVKSKKLQGGFISFKDAFTSFFLTLIIGLSINAVVSMVIFNWIDPNAAAEVQDKFISSQMERLENYNVPEHAITKTIEKIEENGSIYAPINLLKSLIWQIAGYSIIGLIVAAILKKTAPETK